LEDCLSVSGFTTSSRISAYTPRHYCNNVSGAAAFATKNAKGNECQAGRRHNGTALTPALIVKFGEAFEAGAAKPCRLLAHRVGCHPRVERRLSGQERK
jgi:hypothetical protein